MLRMQCCSHIMQIETKGITVTPKTAFFPQLYSPFVYRNFFLLYFVLYRNDVTMFCRGRNVPVELVMTTAQIVMQ